MARFSDIARGTQARQRVPFSVVEGPLPLPRVVDGKLVYDDTPGVVWVEVRVISPGERGDVLERARAYAVAKGVSDPAAGVDLYDIGVKVHTIALAVMDPDDPKNERRFFESADQIFNAKDLSQDHVDYLFEVQQAHQERCSPRRGDLTTNDFIATVTALAVAGDDIPFELLRPASRGTLVRTLAVLYMSSQTPRSESGSASEPST